MLSRINPSGLLLIRSKLLGDPAAFESDVHPKHLGREQPNISCPSGKDSSEKGIAADPQDELFTSWNSKDTKKTQIMI
jgi:hypothetical protein